MGNFAQVMGIGKYAKIGVVVNRFQVIYAIYAKVSLNLNPFLIVPPMMGKVARTRWSTSSTRAATRRARGRHTSGKGSSWVPTRTTCTR